MQAVAVAEVLQDLADLPQAGQAVVEMAEEAA
jgi:hypothetical protein